MNADPMAVQNLFAQAVAIADPKERQTFVHEQCSHNAELLRRVEALLAAYDEPKPFFDQPTAQPGNLPASEPTETPKTSQRPGSLVAGRYKLLEAIGEGGMGTVWVAEQTSPVRRKVALKLVKPGMDSRQVLARFDAERQALALMDHPNIAKVFDGGVTEQGRPFFAMEYVKGMPLTEYCDQTRLSLEERIKLFVPICQAVQHAHQKGIIHRDLKPSNVLICLYDGKPVPKVIDFGLAKAMYQPLTEHTLHTGHGLMIGTPLYMSPEQAEHNNLDVDTRTDIYSLGVMLYELLTGTTPLERAQFKEAAFGEILRLIKEVEPPKPSTRVSTNVQRASIAAQRSLEPEQLGRSIRGDLDWIVMKALDKERDRRYETANGLARDLERFLNQEAVEACPPSTVYRLRKQFQKHRAAISTAAVFLLLVCAGAVVSTWQAIRATKAEQIAVTAEATARQERDKALENERQANRAKAAESNARVAEERARLAESQQRAEAESQRSEAVKQRDEAQRLQQEAVARSTQLQQLTEEQRRAIYASDMNLVRIEAQRGNLQRMREILYQQLPIDHSDLRGFEWYYWYRYLNQAQVVRHFEIPRRDENAPKPVVLPGGKIVAVPKGSETTLVEVQSGQELATFPEAIDKWVLPPSYAALHPDQTVPAETMRRSGRLARAHFAENGRGVFGEYDSRSAFGIALPTAFSQRMGNFSPPQGELHPSGFTVHEPGHAAREFQYPPDAFSHISFLNISQDGRFVGALGNDKNHKFAEPICRLLVWNVDTQEVVLDHVQTRRLNRFAFNRDGSRVAAYYCQGPVSNLSETRDVMVAVDVTEKKELGVAQHDDDIESALWLPDSDRLLVTTLGDSGQQQKELLAWDITANQLQRVSSELMPNHVQTCVSPDGKLVAVGSPGNASIRLIEATTGSLQRTLHHEAAAMESFAFNKEGSQLIAFCDSGDVVQWSTSSSDRDRFALRSKPLEPGVGGASYNTDWEFSDNGELLAYRATLAGIHVRTAAGQEIFHKDAQLEMPKALKEMEQAKNEQPSIYVRPPASVSFFSPGKLRLNPATNLMALVDDRYVVLVDLATGEVRWSTPLDGSRTDSLAIEFSSDQSTVIVASELGVLGFDVKTGTKREIVGNTTQQPFIVSELRQCGDDGQLLVAGLASTEVNSGAVNSIDVRNAMTGERLYSIPFDESSYKGFLPSVPIRVSPSGQKLVRVFNDNVELWDLPSSRLVFKTNGSHASFSHDGQELIISRAASSTPRPASKGTAVKWNPAVESVEIVSTEDGRLITAFSLAGDEADEIRISPDGRRLLTLHGKLPNDAVSRPAHARLWDCESGREILDLPIAADRLFLWDLDFDPTGNLLTGGVLSKVVSSSAMSSGRREGDGRSIWLDATPLPPQADAQLIATNWVNKLKQQTPVPQQMIDTIQKNTVCAPLVRDVALELVGRIAFDPQLVMEQCLEIIERPDSDTSLYQRALSWSKAVEQLEQGSLRTLALVGAAQLRLGQIEQALATLRQREPMQLASDHQDFRWEQLRRSTEILCLHRQGKDPMETHRQAIGLADFVHEAHAADKKSISWQVYTKEALQTQGLPFALSQTKNRIRPRLDATQSGAVQNIVPKDRLAEIREMFLRYDVDRDGKLLQGELPPPYAADYSRFDKSGSEGLSLEKFAALLTVNRARDTADRRIYADRVKISEEFLRWDRDKDGSVTAKDFGPNARLGALDKNQDQVLDLDEFRQFKFESEFKNSLFRLAVGTNPLPDETQLLAVNAAIEDFPSRTSGMLGWRAWLLATSPDDKIRNGPQAVEDATKACKSDGYAIADNIDRLAAAYAATGNFDKALEFAEKAIAMIGPGQQLRDYEARRELYRRKLPYRKSTSDDKEVRDAISASEPPLISADQIQKARRISGGEACWSADGKSLIYALTGFGPEHSYLESLDLKTGEKKVVCGGGQQPVCSPVNGTLAFIRAVSSEPPEIWLYVPVLNKERKLTNGSGAHWISDGKLCYKPWITEDLVCITLDQPDQPLWTRARASSPTASALSPDGKRFGRRVHGKWHFYDLEDEVAVPSLTAYSPDDTGRADWSPDGRFIAYDAKVEKKHRVWLIDTHTQETRLLADLAAYPRWSPDGKTLALGLQSSNEILLLDVSSLDSLWKENAAEAPKQP